MRTEPLREPGLDGLFGCPEGNARFPGVLALGGSEGGVPESLMRLLVPEGFSCLALAYFGTPGTQPALTEVPLERIEQGLRWLRDQPRVETRDGRVSLIGTSKGGELALLVAATFPELVGPVVAYTPSSVVWQAIDFRAPRPPTLSSWSIGAQPLPFVSYPSDVAPQMSERGMSLLPVYERGLDDLETVENAVIPIERAAGPVLLISGGDDHVWPAARMCEMIVDRMRRAGREQLVRHLSFPRAGHMLLPYEPKSAPQTAPITFDPGGDTGTADHAHAEAWPEVVRCLRYDVGAIADGVRA